MTNEEIQAIEELSANLMNNVQLSKEQQREELRNDSNFAEKEQENKNKLLAIFKQTSNYWSFFTLDKTEDIQDDTPLFNFMFYCNLFDDLLEKLGKDKVSFYETLFDVILTRKNFVINILDRYEIHILLPVKNEIQKILSIRALGETAKQQAIAINAGEMVENVVLLNCIPILIELEKANLCKLFDKKINSYISWANCEETFYSTLRLGICVFSAICILYEKELKKKMQF